MFGKVVCAFLLAGAVASAESLGSITNIEEFPSLAQVEFYHDASSIWAQNCVANILTNRHVLSAATCFSESLKDRRIRVGTSQRGLGGQVIEVEQVYIHPNFGLLGYDSDISVVHLADYLTFGEAVRQVAILGQGIELPFGMTVQLAGWGTTAEGGEVASDDLYTLDLFVHDNENCLEKYIAKSDITENMVCVGLGYTRGRDLDSFDKGAPLMYSNTLVGILSFGEAIDDEYPVVATNVGSFTSWIIENAV